MVLRRPLSALLVWAESVGGIATAAVPARAGMINIGAEGQLLVGAVGATAVFFALGESAGPLTLVAGAAGGVLAAEIGAVVEGLVAAAADIENDADIEAFSGVGNRRPAGAHGEEGDMGEQQRPDQEEGTTHDPEGSPPEGRTGRP